MDKIRITSGNLRGWMISSPGSPLTHPMGSREKLALFNMLSANLIGAKVLDAFSGSGALGIEALSRGAREVVFIEKSPKVAKVLKENLQSLDLTGVSKVFIGEVRRFKSDETFDIIMADPPYDNFNLKEVFYLTKYLKNGGWFILSHPEFAPEILGLKLTKTRKYAKANISIYQKIA